MRGLVIAASLACLLSAGPVFAQTPPAQTPPAQPKPVPPAQIMPPPAQQPPAPFPQGAKIAFVNFQRVVSDSADGKASSAKIQALNKKKQDEGTQKAQQLKANQDKLQASGGVMSDAARGQLEKEIERQQVEAQRFQQDAQAEVTELQTQLQGEFQQKLFPVLYQMSQEKGLYVLLSATDAGVIWSDSGIDLTLEAIKRFDAAMAAKPGAPATAAPAPTAPPATAPKPPAATAPKPPAPTVPKK